MKNQAKLVNFIFGLVFVVGTIMILKVACD
jgi:hypothetical protein